jgi:hypothetical protein
MKKVNFKSLCNNFCFDSNKVHSHTVTSKFSRLEVFYGICFIASLFSLEYTHQEIYHISKQKCLTSQQEQELAPCKITDETVSCGVEAEDWGSRLALQ